MCTLCVASVLLVFFFFQAEDGIRDLVRSRGLGDVYKRQPRSCAIRPRGTASSPVVPASAGAESSSGPWSDRALSLIHI